MFSGQGQICEEYDTILDSSTHIGCLHVGFIYVVPIDKILNQVEKFGQRREGTISNFQYPPPDWV